MKVQSSEKGQALILIILAIVVIFGFAALAVDGGRIYSERRRAQAAADSAALGAAYEAASGKKHSTARAKALLLAEYNGFQNTTGPDGLPVKDADVLVEYNNPPVSGPYKGDILYHQVLITERVDPIFSQLLYGGETEIVVEAVSYSTADCTDCFSAGNAIHAMNATEPSALEFDGSVSVNVINGSIFSNSKASDSGRKNGGSGIISVQNGKISVVGGWKGDVNPEKVSPKPIEGVASLSVPNAPVPDCGNSVPLGSQSGSTLYPGRFPTGIKLNGNNDYIMKPGMYCIEGGFTVNGNVTVEGEGVFIAMMSGELYLNGSAKVTLTYANDLKDGKGNQWGGMLIYAPYGNKAGVKLDGGNETVYRGTIYVPDAECSLGGNSASYGFHAKILCDTVKIHGSTIVVIDYDPTYNWHFPPMVELKQ